MCNMLNLFIYVLLFYNEVFGYRVDNGQSGGEANEQINLLNSRKDLTYQIQNAMSDSMSSNRNRDSFHEALEHWNGRWFPEQTVPSNSQPKVDPATTGSQHNVPMGRSVDCDDGKTNLTVDWDFSPKDYTCYGQKIIPDYSIDPKVHCVPIPEYYTAAHVCMNKTIEYDENIPTYGTHRPVWPVYGEYKFLPRQRWLHSLEHGGVVMLYHPCANPLEVKRLKYLVKNCLRRHIITPYSLLDEDRPLALVTWGCHFTMSYTNPKLIKKYIQEKALQGPEAVRSDGHYNEELIEKAKIISDKADSNLCPQI